MRNRIAVVSLGLALVALAYVAFITLFEKIPYNERGPAISEVKNNPYYGFSQYLATKGIATERVHSLTVGAQLPDTRDTLFFTNLSDYLSEQRLSAIAQWVAEGGHMVTPNPHPSHATILRYMGFVAPPIEKGNNESEELCAEDPCNKESNEDSFEENSMENDAYEENPDEDTNQNTSLVDDADQRVEDSTNTQDENEENTIYDPSELADDYVAILDGDIIGVVSNAYFLYWTDIDPIRPVSKKLTYSRINTFKQQRKLGHERQKTLPVNDNMNAEDSNEVSYDTYYNATDVQQHKNEHETPPTTESLVTRLSQWVPDQDDTRQDRVFAASFDYGLGKVTVIGTDTQIDNPMFYEADNSFVMYKLLSGDRPPGKVWFISVFEKASLWDVLWTKGAHVILWLGLCIICFFWWASQRFGRIFPAPHHDRREFLEHIAASGRFLWHNRQHQELVANAKQYVRQRLIQRYSYLRSSGEHTLRQHCATLLEQGDNTWDIAMGNLVNSVSTQNKHQFVEQMKALQTIWKTV